MVLVVVQGFLAVDGDIVFMYDYVLSVNVGAEGGADKEIMRIITAYRYVCYIWW